MKDNVVDKLLLTFVEVDVLDAECGNSRFSELVADCLADVKRRLNSTVTKQRKENAHMKNDVF